MPIFVGQKALRFEARTKTNISGALETKILYKKPDLTTGEWTASILDASQGIIYYDVGMNTELDQDGDWRLRSYVKFSDGREAKGRVVQVTVYEDEF